MNLREQYGIPHDAIISVAGTVGVGKSTFTLKLAEALGFKTSMEKVENNPYLEKYYHDFQRWAFNMQIYFLGERFKEQKRMFQYGGGFVQDRSIYEDTSIFAKMHHDKGTISDEDFDTYQSLFEAMVLTPYFPKPDLVIYLEGDLEEVLHRIGNRGRQMEIDTPKDYWEELHLRYKTWIDNFNDAPLLRLNIKEYDLLHDENAIHFILKKISRIMGSIPQKNSGC